MANFIELNYVAKQLEIHECKLDKHHDNIGDFLKGVVENHAFPVTGRGGTNAMCSDHRFLECLLNVEEEPR